MNLSLVMLMMERTGSCETFKVHGVTNQRTGTLRVKADRNAGITLSIIRNVNSRCELFPVLL